MAVIRLVLVGQSQDGLEVIPVPDAQQLSLDVHPDTALEAVRSYFRQKWGAMVHALRWVVPDDLLLATVDREPSLVLFVDEPGDLRFAHQGDGSVSPVLLESVRSCSYQPWSDPDWFASKCRWVVDMFGAVENIEQVRVNLTGAVIKIQAPRGSYFLKALPSFFAHEASLMTLLDKQFPGFCPTVLPFHPDDRTHITGAIEGRALRSIDNADEWRSALKTLARKQIGALVAIEGMASTGTPVQSFPEFAVTINESIARLVILQSGAVNELNAAELKRIQELTVLCLQDCESLREISLPDTIVHGDLNESNIFVGPRGTTLIDWSYARIGHPFFIVGYFPFVADGNQHRLHSVQSSLKQAYLEEWCHYDSPRQLLRGLDAALRLSWVATAVHVSKYIQILQADEPGSIMYVPSMLRNAFTAYGIVCQ